jgi:cell shape-determining protein MreC
METQNSLDLKSVDYDAISMLNVSATQELAEKVEALEAENAELKAQNNRLATLEAQMKALQKSVRSQQNGDEAIRPIA